MKCPYSHFKLGTVILLLLFAIPEGGEAVKYVDKKCQWGAVHERIESARNVFIARFVEYRSVTEQSVRMPGLFKVLYVWKGNLLAGQDSYILVPKKIKRNGKVGGVSSGIVIPESGKDYLVLANESEQKDLLKLSGCHSLLKLSSLEITNPRIAEINKNFLNQ